MSDLLRGLKEKMKFDREAFNEEYTEQRDSEDRERMFPSQLEISSFMAEWENARLQAIVLKEVGPLMKALREIHWKCGKVESNYIHKEGPYQKEISQIWMICDEALEKFRGGK